jgi:predicted PurR-regulated permease PerM
MGEGAMPSTDTSRNRMLPLIATVVATAALRASYPVTMPLAASILLIAAVWPLKLWLDRLVPRASYVSYVGTSLILLLIWRSSLRHPISRLRSSFRRWIGDSSKQSIGPQLAG